jgi:hypothetical protein
MGGCLWIYRDKKLLDLCAFFHYFIPAGLKATNVSYTTMWLLKLLENLIAAVSVSGIVTLKGLHRAGNGNMPAWAAGSCGILIIRM